MNDDWFYDDNDDFGDPYQEPLDDYDEFAELFEFEWMEELKVIHEESEELRDEEAEEARRSAAARKAWITRHKQKWAKEDEERKSRRGRKYRSIDDA